MNGRNPAAATSPTSVALPPIDSTANGRTTAVMRSPMTDSAWPEEQQPELALLAQHRGQHGGDLRLRGGHQALEHLGVDVEVRVDRVDVVVVLEGVDEAQQLGRGLLVERRRAPWGAA